uniref:Putative secreted protein n=1 Tax=Anopheles darlingi TaxID=43151 RepID=A0A2M4D6J1_ANODA
MAGKSAALAAYLSHYFASSSPCSLLAFLITCTRIDTHTHTHTHTKHKKHTRGTRLSLSSRGHHSWVGLFANFPATCKRHTLRHSASSHGTTERNNSDGDGDGAAQTPEARGC